MSRPQCVAALHTMAEVARVLGVTDTGVKHLEQRGRIPAPAYRVGPRGHRLWSGEQMAEIRRYAAERSGGVR